MVGPCRISDPTLCKSSSQVVCDVAGAIGEMDRLGYVHRDITPWNIGQVEGRGCLFDMSIAKVVYTLGWSY